MAKTKQEFETGPESIDAVIKIAPPGVVLDPRKTDGRKLRKLLHDFKEAIFGAAERYAENFYAYMPPGHTFGKYKNGDLVLAAGKSALELQFDAMNDVQPPAYNAPSASIAVTLGDGSLVPAEREVGEDLVFRVAGTFHQNDAGAATAYHLQRDQSDIAGASNPYTFAAIRMTEAEVAFRVGFNYAIGPIKLNDAGEPDERGRIPAGSVFSSEARFRGFRKLFAGFDPANDAAAARELPLKIQNPGGGLNFNVAIPVGAPRVEILYPATLPDLSSVKYVEDSNKVITGNYVRGADLSIPGANGYAPITYKRFTFVPVEPFQFAATHNFTL